MVRQLDDPGIISGTHVNTMSALTPKWTCGSAIAMSANGQKQTQLQNKGSALQRKFVSQRRVAG